MVVYLTPASTNSIKQLAVEGIDTDCIIAVPKPVHRHCIIVGEFNLIVV